MPKYWVTNYFAHGRFPEVGQKQKTEKERKKERKLVITMAKLRMAHVSRLGQNLLNISITNVMFFRNSPSLHLSRL